MHATLTRSGNQRLTQKQNCKKPSLMMFSAILILSLSACATAPPAQIVCPQRPELPVRMPTGLNWQESMESFLQGTLPSLPDKMPPYQPVTQP